MSALLTNNLDRLEHSSAHHSTVETHMLPDQHASNREQAEVYPQKEKKY